VVRQLAEFFGGDSQKSGIASAGHDQRQYAFRSRLRFVLKRRGPHSKGRAQEPESPYHEKKRSALIPPLPWRSSTLLAALISEQAHSYPIHSINIGVVDDHVVIDQR
jgi:hypothetical protein